MRYLDARVTPAEEVIEAFVVAFAEGRIVGFPTDTVYGIGCSPHELEAIARIYALKGRSEEKPLSLLFGSVDELLDYGQVNNHIAEAAARHFLPGGMTLIVSRPAHIDPAVTAGRATVGLRVPQHALLQSLLTQVGPLASTSANFSGAAAYDGGGAPTVPDVDLFIDAGPTIYGRESSVVDFTCEPPTILREGAIEKAAFATWLRDLDVV